jgi:predicted membrane protein
MPKDHVFSLLLYSVLVALFFGVLNHRDRKGFLLSVAKTLAWMVVGSLAFGFLMLWTGR